MRNDFLSAALMFSSFAPPAVISGGMARILIGKNIFSTEYHHSHRHENGGPLPSPPIFLPGNILAPAQQRQHATPPQSPNPRRSPARSLGLLARFLLSGEHDSPSFTHHFLPSSQGSETNTFPSDVGPGHAKLVKDVWVKDVPGLEIPSLRSLASMLEDHVESAKCKEVSEFRVPTEYTGKNIGARK